MYKLNLKILVLYAPFSGLSLSLSLYLLISVGGVQSESEDGKGKNATEREGAAWKVADQREVGKEWRLLEAP